MFARIEPYPHKGTMRLLKLLKPLEGTEEHKELLEYIGRLEQTQDAMYQTVQEFALKFGLKQRQF